MSLDFSQRVRDLLDSPKWQALSGTKQQDLCQKLDMLEAIGAPPMRVISSNTLREKGYIPRSNEVLHDDEATLTTTIDAREAIRFGEKHGSGGAVLIFLSHRWLQHDHPDDNQQTKFRALMNWSNWYETVYSKRNTRQLYFWIDWSCMDQDNHGGQLELGVQSLPLYVSVCNDFLCYETTDYYERAWCILERVIAYAFTFAGKIPWVINQDFACARIVTEVDQKEEEQEATAKSSILYKPVERILLDPRDGKCLCEEDRKFHAILTQCALTSKAWTGGDGRNLVFGETAVMAQVMYCT